MEIINMQMRHYLHNGKGYRALPYTKLKLMLCAFQPYINLNFRFLWHRSPFLRVGHICCCDLSIRPDFFVLIEDQVQAKFPSYYGLVGIMAKSFYCYSNSQ